MEKLLWLGVDAVGAALMDWTCREWMAPDRVRRMSVLYMGMLDALSAWCRHGASPQWHEAVLDLIDGGCGLAFAEMVHAHPPAPATPSGRPRATTPPPDWHIPAAIDTEGAQLPAAPFPHTTRVPYPDPPLAIPAATTRRSPCAASGRSAARPARGPGTRRPIPARKPIPKSG